MIDESWMKQVIDVVGQISDRDFQVRSWTGAGPEVSSYDEVLSQLIDDQSFEDFCNKLNSSELKNSCCDLLLAVNALDIELRDLESLQIIDDPRWMKVRTLAGIAVKTLKSYENGQKILP